MKNSMILGLKNLILCLFLVGAVAALPLTVHSAATIFIVNNDGPNEGFNDPTPAAPVGGNPGTTIGAQRLNAFQHAANIWGANLNSSVAIYVLANFDPLACTATSAVLGFAGPMWVWRDFTGAPLAGHWYNNALANKLYGSDLTTPANTGDPDPNNNVEIAARFNSNLGQAGCLTGVPFYYGLDNNHGTLIDLVTVVLHELAHGLGFSTTTSGITGALLAGFPSAYDHFTFDLTSNKVWDSMNNAERVASAINARNVVWTGSNVNAGVPVVLDLGTPELVISAPVSVADTYLVGTASFGPPLTSTGVTGHLMPITGLDPVACNPLIGANALAANGNIALIDRGICAFTTKVKNAQNAGARGVVIVNNVGGSPPPGMGGTDPTITIPSVMITQEDGNLLKAALRFRSRTRSGVITTLDLNLLQRSGADSLGRALLFTPDPFQDGSSVLHWDTIASPNLLMEPYNNADLTHSVDVPFDLTLPLLKDLGW